MKQQTRGVGFVCDNRGKWVAYSCSIGVCVFRSVLRSPCVRYFFSDDDNARTRAQIAEHRAVSTARATVLLVPHRAADAGRPINWRRSRAKCAARRRCLTSRSADRLKLLASGQCQCAYCCRASSSCFSLLVRFYLGLFQFPSSFQSPRETTFPRFSHDTPDDGKISPWVSCARRLR